MSRSEVVNAGTRVSLERKPASDPPGAGGAKHGEEKTAAKEQSDPQTALAERALAERALAEMTSSKTAPLTATAAKTMNPPLTTADRSAIVRQVADSVGTMPLPTAPGKTEQMTLQLHPKDWGSLHVSVTLTPGTDTGGARTVTAHIVAETPQVKAALESGLGDLHQTLRAAGLHLDHLTVSVKPAEVKPADAKLIDVKAASDSAAAGMPFDQSRPGAGSEFSQGAAGQGTAGQGAAGQTPETSANSVSAAQSFAAFSGGSQDGRQGQPGPPPGNASLGAEPEPDAAPAWKIPSLHSATGRLDTHA